MKLARIAMAVALTAVAASPLLAQEKDPTMQVAGSGLPAGWMVRFDPSRPGRPAATVAEVNFRVMAPGWHHNSGPAGIYYRGADATKGTYTVSATFAQMKSMQHEAYGIFIGGSELQGDKQNYLYFLVKPADGTLACTSCEAPVAHRGGFCRREGAVCVVSRRPAGHVRR